MARLRLAAIRILDWLDDRIIGHRSYRLCQWIEAHPWGGGEGGGGT